MFYNYLSMRSPYPFNCKIVLPTFVYMSGQSKRQIYVLHTVRKALRLNGSVCSVS